MKLKKSYTIAEIATHLDSKVEGDESIVIDGIGRIEESKPGEVLFISGKEFISYLKVCTYNCILIPPTMNVEPMEGQAFIRVKHPHAAFATLISLFFPNEPTIPSTEETAFIHPTASLGENVVIHAGAYIGPNCVIGDDCIIHPYVVLSGNVSMGNHCIAYPHVVCYANTVIGNNVILHAGCVIGSDGFGYIESSDGSYRKIKHVGNVILEDDVEIGSNTTIDRSVVNSTIISKGVKIDNLVQIGHNVSIGEHTAFAAQVGIAGSAKIGARNRFAGQVGTVGHLSTADDVIVYGQSGIAQSIEQSGIYFGSPAIERCKEMRRIYASQQLPELLKLINSLELRIKELEQARDNEKTS
ncbi:MAG: UDP-3-O-(3-hydroxymyristoyl)glucosamine N-acyltransferase [Candidatus Kapaibacteriota bacterium]